MIFDRISLHFPTVRFPFELVALQNDGGGVFVADWIKFSFNWYVCCSVGWQFSVDFQLRFKHCMQWKEGSGALQLKDFILTALFPRNAPTWYARHLNTIKSHRFLVSCTSASTPKAIVSMIFWWIVFSLFYPLTLSYSFLSFAPKHWR